MILRFQERGVVRGFRVPVEFEDFVKWALSVGYKPRTVYKVILALRDGRDPDDWGVPRTMRRHIRYARRLYQRYLTWGARA